VVFSLPGAKEKTLQTPKRKRLWQDWPVKIDGGTPFPNTGRERIQMRLCIWIQGQDGFSDYGFSTRGKKGCLAERVQGLNAGNGKD